jgi:cytochrome c556
MMRSIFVAGALALGVTAAVAQATNVIEQRQNLMKQNGAHTRTVSGMLRGQAPFDMAQVQTALQNYVAVGQQFHTLFPEDSKTGNNTKALPAIWENKADFTAQSLKLSQDAQAALTAIKDEATFKTEMPKVLGNCQSCHSKYQRQG